MKENPANVPLHIFLSFSNLEKDFVKRFASDLRKAGIPVWADYENLIVGTVDWELAIRDAISNSFAVLLLASPESRKSVYVKGEVNVAATEGIPIYPIWVDGQDWADCVPLGMTNSQYIDARGERYSDGFLEIRQILKDLINKSVPKHYLITPLWKRDKTIFRKFAPIPPSCLCVMLPPIESSAWPDNYGSLILAVKAATYCGQHRLANASCKNGNRSIKNEADDSGDHHSVRHSRCQGLGRRDR